MKPESQRIAIAEFCGWKLKETEAREMHWPGGMMPTKVKRWFNPNDQMWADGHKDIPDYLHDLNAIQSAFGILDEQQKRICVGLVVTTLKPGQFLFDASAAQWAEGVLRTIGRWTD